MSETADTHAPRPLPWHHRAPVLTMARHEMLPSPHQACMLLQAQATRRNRPPLTPETLFG